MNEANARVTTVFMVLAHDGLIAQPTLWTSLLRAAPEFEMIVYTGELYVNQLPMTFQDRLIGRNLPDTRYGEIVPPILALLAHARATFVNLTRCFLVCGYTVPVRPVEWYLKTTSKSSVSFETFRSNETNLPYLSNVLWSDFISSQVEWLTDEARMVNLL